MMGQQPPLPDHYGTDELYRFLLGLCFALALIRLPVRGAAGWVLLAVICFSAVWAVSRALSRNHPARRAENRAFLRLRNGVIQWCKWQYLRLRDRRVCAYRRCPECGAVIRLRRVRGEHVVTCPRCGEKYPIYIP